MKTSAGIYFKRLLVLAFLLLSACATARYEGPSSGMLTASWYGPGFHGKLTASGEQYDMNALTCAHKSLPFGTRLRVTNESEDKSVTVVVNDRGPFIPGRDLDLSYAAAKEIGIVGPGTGKVRVEMLDRDTRYIRQVSVASTSSSGPYTIQVGSFKEGDNATRLKDAIELKYNSVYITSVEINGEKFYRVRLGKFRNKPQAYHGASLLADEGYSPIVTQYEERI